MRKKLIICTFSIATNQQAEGERDTQINRLLMTRLFFGSSIARARAYVGTLGTDHERDLGSLLRHCHRRSVIVVVVGCVLLLRFCLFVTHDPHICARSMRLIDIGDDLDWVLLFGLKLIFFRKSPYNGCCDGDGWSFSYWKIFGNTGSVDS